MDEKKHPHIITYTVNDEPQSTEEKSLTPVQIMTSAGVDPSTNYLLEIKGHQSPISFKDNSTVPIEMHNNMKFITNFTGPTPVS